MSKAVRETLGSCIQAFLFVCLIPVLFKVFGVLLKDSGAMGVFTNYITGMIPGGSEYDFFVKSLTGSMSAENFIVSLNNMMSSINDEFTAIMYVGMWMHAFRVIFKEIIPIPGLPIFQMTFGLLFGALTLNMLDGLMMTLMVTLFLFVLNIVLIIITGKFVVKKILDIAFDVSIESLNVILTSCYIMLIGMLGTGYSATDIMPVFLTIVIIWLIMNLIRYFAVMKLG